MKAFNLKTALEYRNEVTELSLHFGQLTEIPAEVFELNKLRKLTISCNELTEIPQAVTSLTQLESLNFWKNKLKHIPGFLAELPLLRELDLRDNPLETIPGVIFRLKNLQMLDLRNTGLKELPEAIGDLSALRELNLHRNAISKIPARIGRLRELRLLDISRNRITRLPKAVGDCARLEKLDAGGNLLRALPESIGQLQQLRHLIVNDNRLKSLPPAIGECKMLRTLEAGSNKLDSIPETIGNLQWMASLRLDGNNLNDLPPGMLRCRQLQTLDLGYNDFSKLPGFLTQLPNLTTLVVPGNDLERLPGACESLTRLVISRNRLRELDDSILHSLKLQHLDISNNAVRRLPAGMQRLQRLHTLNASGNPFEEFPEVLLFLDRLEMLAGVINYEQKKRFFLFMKACRNKEVEAFYRVPLFRLLNGDEKALDALGWKGWMQALTFPMEVLKYAARDWLLTQKSLPPEVRPLGRGASIALAGETWFDWKEVTPTLHAQGVGLRHSIDRQTTHVLLGNNPVLPAEEPEQPLVFMIERDLTAFLDKAEKRYLVVEQDPEKIMRVRQLLHHSEEGKVELAIQLLRGGGVPQALLTDLLIAWKQARSHRISRELRKLLDLNISEEAKRAIRRPISLRGKLSKETLVANIQKLTVGNEFDGERIARYFGGLDAS
jgi:Leucine-rich repeat (LRR) protein